jgi:dihydropteroate synthase
MLRIEHIADLADRYRADLTTRVREFTLGPKTFPFNTHPAIMGVVNLSPDSWYRESVCLSAEAAIRRARILTEQGADIIDIGAESTLAHAARVDPQAQTTRLLPIITELARANILVSVETYDPQVARASLQAGAKILNLTGAADQETFRTAADHDAAAIICYVHGPNVREATDLDLTTDPVHMMREYFQRQADLATSAGLHKILIDPGLGFYYPNLQDSATRVRHQLNTLLNTFRYRTLGYPVCHALPHAFETFGPQVRSAEPFFAAIAALGKTDLYRTHEVPRVRAVLQTMQLF